MSPASANGSVPRDLDAERAVLGACLTSPEALSKVVGELETREFYSETHRRVFSAIKAAAREHREIDQVVVGPYLPEEADRAFIFGLLESVPGHTNALKYAKVVREAAAARELLDVADRMKERAASGDFEDAPAYALSEIEAVLRRGRGGARPIGEDVESVEALIREAHEHQGVTGIRTGIGKLDLAVKGLNPGRFYVVAGRPAMGKSLVCGQIALTAARRGSRVLLQSPEMGGGEYLQRLAVATSGVSAEEAHDGKLSGEAQSAVMSAAMEIGGLPFFIDDRGTQTVADIRRNVLRYEPDLVIVDYLQRLVPDDYRLSRYEQVSQISYDLDRIKKDFDVPVVAAAQLSRAVEQRSDKHPMLSDLRDSGTVEQDADGVVMLYRPHYYDSDAEPARLEMHLEKNRHGPTVETAVEMTQSLWVGPSVEGVAS